MKREKPTPKSFTLSMTKDGKPSNFYQIAVAAGLARRGDVYTFESRSAFNDALTKTIEDKEAVIRLLNLHVAKGWDFNAFLEKRVRLYIQKYGNELPNNVTRVFKNCETVGVDCTHILDEVVRKARSEVQEAFTRWRTFAGGEVYTNLVLAVPHAVSKLSFNELSQNEQVRMEVARWTDWYTDELFDVRHERISCVKFPYSRIEVDAERLKGEVDRIAAFRLAEKGGVVKEVSSQQWNKYLAAWFRYRVELLEAAALGEKPLIIDCHSFPADLNPEIDVCLGINDDATKPSDTVINNVKDLFEEAGYRVALNIPYSNTIAPVDYQGHSLMIELNKQTYMEDNLRKHSVAFKKMKDTLLEVYSYLLNEIVENGEEVDEDSCHSVCPIMNTSLQQLRLEFERPHKCKYCSLSYTTKEELERHIREIHDGLNTELNGMSANEIEQRKQRNQAKLAENKKWKLKSRRLRENGRGGVLN